MSTFGEECGPGSRAAVYARVSSDKQRDAKTIETQIRLSPEFLRARQWPQVVDPGGKPSALGVFVDDGMSAKTGRLAARAAFHRLKALMAAGAIDVVVMIAQDRLTRTEDMEERGQILGAIQKAGVKLASMSNGMVLDLNTAMGDLMANMQAAADANFNRQLRMRVVEGRQTAIKRKRKPGGVTTYGYRYNRAAAPGEEWSLHEVEAPIVHEIYTRLAAGESSRVIADDLTARGVPPGGRAKYWTRERVWNLANHTIYRGQWMADRRRRLTIPVPRIVDDALWFVVHNGFRASGLRGLRRTKYVYLLEGIATCELCGGRIGIDSQRGPGKRGTRDKMAARYICINRRRLPAPGIARCTLPTIRTADADDRAWAEIRKLVADDRIERRTERARKGAAPPDAAKDLKAIEGKIARLETAEAGILERFQRGLISDGAMDRSLAAITRDRSALDVQLKAARQLKAAAAVMVVKAISVRDALANLRRQVEGAPPELRRRLAALAHVTAVVGPTKIAVTYDAGQALSAARGTSHETGALDLTFRLVA